jgi:hypothetical protein
MRYSVSPRYEFELVVSKLSWLNKWISPMELKAAMDRAQSAMQGHVVPVNDKPPPAPKQMPQNNPAPQGSHKENTLSDELRRMMAAKARPVQPAAAQPAAILPDDEPQPSPQGEGSPLDDEEPIWRMGSLKSGALNSAAQNNAAIANESTGDESPVDRVLRIIPGTVIK